MSDDQIQVPSGLRAPGGLAARAPKRAVNVLLIDGITVPDNERAVVRVFLYISTK